MSPRKPLNALDQTLMRALDPVADAEAAGFTAEDWQARLLRSRARRIAVVCGRQVGKTTTTAHKALHVARHTPERDVLIVSPSQRQSTEMLVRIKAIYRTQAGAGRLKRDNDSEITLANGSPVVSLPGNEGTIRGFANIRLLVVDEAARVDDDVFASAVPMVGSSDGQLIALSTPWGQRGWFYEVAEHDETNAWEHYRVSVHESAQWSAERIAATRQTVSRFAWTSDYEAVFGDAEGQLFAQSDIERAFALGAGIPPLFT